MNLGYDSTIEHQTEQQILQLQFYDNGVFLKNCAFYRQVVINK